MVVPTKRFWLLAALGIFAAILAGLSGQVELLLLFDFLIVLTALLTGLAAPKESEIKVSRSFSPVLSVRVPNVVKVTIENLSNRDFSVLVRDEPDGSFRSEGQESRLHVREGESETYTYKTTPPERGTFSFRGTFLRIRCPLGLVDRQYRIETRQEARVYPNVLAMKEFEMLNQRGRLKEVGLRKSKQRGLGMEFESLREYSQGDDYRKIDWKATARKGKLIVRQYEVEKSQNVLIAIDCGRHMLGEADGATKLDCALDASLMLTKAALSAGDNVGVLCFRERVLRYIPPRRSAGQLGILVSTLHDLLAFPVESDYDGAFGYLSRRWRKRSLVVIFTDAADIDRAKRLTVGLGPLIRSHVVVVVQVNDPKINELLESPLQTANDLYRRAAGLAIADEVTSSVAIMKGVRLHVVSAEPQDLPKALVNFYYKVKERALI